MVNSGSNAEVRQERVFPKRSQEPNASKQPNPSGQRAANGSFVEATANDPHFQAQSRDRERGIRNVQATAQPKDLGYDATERPGELQRSFEEEQSLEAQAHASNDPRIKEEQAKEENFRANQEQIIAMSQAEDFAVRQQKIRLAKKGPLPNQTSLGGKASAVGGFARWGGVAIAFEIYLFQLLFALFSLVGFGLKGGVLKTTGTGFLAKTIGAVWNTIADTIVNVLPIEEFAFAFWGLAALLTLAVFFGYLFWFFMNDINPFNSVFSFLITTLCFALNFLPVSNLFPFLVIWIIYINANSTIQQAKELVTSVRGKI